MHIDLNKKNINRFGDTPAATAQNSVPNNTQNSFTPVRIILSQFKTTLNQYKITLITNSFTTATKIPEFNIATPNSASTFVQIFLKMVTMKVNSSDFNDDSKDQ